MGEARRNYREINSTVQGTDKSNFYAIIASQIQLNRLSTPTPANDKPHLSSGINNIKKKNKATTNIDKTKTTTHILKPYKLNAP